MMTSMRFQPIIVPGWKNSGPDHWQSRWQQVLPHAVRVEQTDWDHPTRTEWVGALSAAIDAATCPVLLVAHSLGCVTSAAVPTALRQKIAGALLVAPADVERANAPQCLRDFVPIARQPLPFQSVVVASDNDPYCSVPRAREFADAWGSRFVVVPAGGHLNAEAGLGDWPQGWKMLTALRRRCAWRVTTPPPRIAPLHRLSAVNSH